MTREEFEKTVRAMQDNGVALTMPNLMVRTELPRAQIEAWLDAMQRDVKFTPPASAAREAEHESRSKPASGLVDRARALKQEVLGEAAGKALKDKLGIETRPKVEGPRREIKRGAILGLALPPVGLAYSAPWRVAGIGAAIYAAALAMAFVPVLGTFAIMYLLIPAHLAGGALGAAYAWRYNRKGRRSNLLPGGDEKK